MKYEEIILSMAEENNGTVTAKETTSAYVPRRVLGDMVNKKLLIKTARGVYLLPEAWDDEWLALQYRFSRGIYSHETALYLHGYSDRTPAEFNMTFPRGYHSEANKEFPINAHYAVDEIYDLGITMIDSPAGHEVQVYDLEKTLCDVVRSEKNFDVEIVNAAMKRYAADKSRNVPKLMKYAAKLRVEKRIRNYMEVLL